MALNEEKLVVGTAGRKTLVWDLRNMSTGKIILNSFIRFSF